MIFIIPFLIGAIGVAVGAVGGAFAAHAAGEKDRQASKHHRKVSDELNDKYSKLQQDYYELGDKSKAENKRLTERLAISEVEKDALHLVVELQQAIIGLMTSIDESPSYEALTQLNIAIKATNQVLSHLDKNLIQINSDYFDRNLNRVIAIEGSDIRALIAEDPNTSPLLLKKLSKDLFWIREAVAYNTSTPDDLLNALKNDECSDVSIAAEKNLDYQHRLKLFIVKYQNQVSIKACNDKYVMSQLNRRGKIAAKAEHTKEWEKFEIINIEDSFSDNKNIPIRYGERVAFRSIANDKFVCSDLGNSGKLIASAPHIKEWETFTMLPFQDDQKLGRSIEYGNNFILQVHNNKQVYCRLKENGRLCIDSPRNDLSDVFVFVRPNN